MTNSCPESSPTHSHLLKPCMRKQSFSKQNLLFCKIHYRSVGKNSGLPFEANWLVSFPKQSWSSSEVICWPISQPNSLEIHPVKFLWQLGSFFQKSHVMHSHLTSRLPSAYEMHYDAISTRYIQHMLLYKTCIYNNIIKAHKACYAHSPSITPKISSQGLINKHEQFYLNYSPEHIFLKKYFLNTIHMNSKTLELLFTTTFSTSVPPCEPEIQWLFRPFAYHNII